MDRIALITGASKGVGRSIAIEFALILSASADNGVMRIKNKLTYIDLATTSFSMNKVKNFRRANEEYECKRWNDN